MPMVWRRILYDSDAAGGSIGVEGPGHDDGRALEVRKAGWQFGLRGERAFGVTESGTETAGGAKVWR